MKLSRNNTHRFLTAAGLALVALPLACGGDLGNYQDETLNVDMPVKGKSDNEVTDLDLGSEESSDFHFAPAFPLVPWGPYPLYDYYLEPVPVAVPVSPVFSLIDYVHPFYAYAYFDGFNDDDDGLFFRDDDQ